MMYRAYWGLTDSPFRGALDPRRFHQGATQEEALARLHFLVDEHRSLGLLLGESGSGKSLLLEVFARQLGRIGRQSARISLVGIDVHELLWSLGAQLGIEVRSGATQFKLARSLDDFLSASRYQKLTTLLLLDDADDARTDVLDQVLRLIQNDVTRETLLTVVLAAQPGRLYRLGNRLLELAELRIDLEGWEAEDTAEFIKGALSAAGRSSPIFTPPALARLHELSGGIPRRVKQLADLALLAGAGGGLTHIEPETIEAVYQELGVVADIPTLSQPRI